jgi:hypothetical protein
MSKKLYSMTVRLDEETNAMLEKLVAEVNADFHRRNPDINEPLGLSSIVRMLIPKMAVAQGKQGERAINGVRQRRAC